MALMGIDILEALARAYKLANHNKIQELAKTDPAVALLVGGLRKQIDKIYNGRIAGSCLDEAVFKVKIDGEYNPFISQKGVDGSGDNDLILDMPDEAK